MATIVGRRIMAEKPIKILPKKLITTLMFITMPLHPLGKGMIDYFSNP